jgi:hypothetical protein
MPETQQITFTHAEVAEALIKTQDIHEGLWGMYVEFGIAAANISGGPEGDFFPAAIVPLVKVGIQRFDKASNLTVDAAVVNPEAVG